jgi:succinate dehydrogenase / fumarate reductase cytochrome b subunit
VATSAPSFFERNHFLLRRLHSLSGIVPIGVFLLEHLLTNSLAFKGPKAFNEQVQWIQDMPFLLAIEILFIFLPLAFHAIYGVVIAWQGKLNASQYPYMDNWRYTLQRVTAWITIVFVAVHLLHFRFGYLLGTTPFADATQHGGYFAFTQHGFTRLLPTWAWMIFYAIGLTSAVFHFCNGIVTFCITWGVTVGITARKRLSYATGCLAIVLLLWGGLSLVALGSNAAAHNTEVRVAPPVAQRAALP